MHLFFPQFSRKYILNIHWRDWCWGSNTLATWCKGPTHWKRPWCWERSRAGGEGNRGWDGWIASLTQWTWIWTNSGRWWRTGKPGVPQTVGSQRARHDWATKQQPLCYTVGPCWLPILNKECVHVNPKLPNYPFPKSFLPTPSNHKFIL